MFDQVRVPQEHSSFTPVWIMAARLGISFHETYMLFAHAILETRNPILN